MGQAEFEAAVLVLQRQLDRVETPRLERVVEGEINRRDPLDKVAAPNGCDEESEGEEFAQANEAEMWRQRTLRMTACLVGTLRMVAAEERFPKLVAWECLLACGAEGPSMRELATAYNLSPERISQRVEAVQKRFSLPPNQHNKSAAAVLSYQAAASARRGAA
jgi:hypothetical protein